MIFNKFKVLQSTSHIVVNHGKPKVNPSPTLRILKTAAPVLNNKIHKHHPHQLDPTPVATHSEETLVDANVNNLIKSTRRISHSGETFKPRFRNRKEQDLEEKPEHNPNHHNYKKSQHRARPTPSKSHK